MMPEYSTTESELIYVYNRLQEANKIIAELIGLLKESIEIEHLQDRVHITNGIKAVLKKYQHITGE